MGDRDVKDVIAGGLLALFGVFVGLYASSHYPMGTLREIGPGMFPAGLGYILAAIGLVILIPALRRRPVHGEPLEWQSLATVMGSVAVFALLVRPFGLVPAIVTLTVVSSYADARLGFIKALGLGIALTVIATMIFRVTLGTPFPLFRWPF